MNPDKPTLLALAERVEKAAGPDRELDALITVALDLRPDWLIGSAGEIWFTGEFIGDNPIIRFRDDRMKRSPGNPPSAHCPHFTASLDAAMTLVPEGYGFDMSQLGADWKARALILAASGNIAGECKAATTLALALTAACLRAQASILNDTEGDPE